ncbi:MAG: NnrU family protein [Pseudomonadales bacterium]
MGLLISGLLLWSFVHFVPSLMPGLKQSWKGALGEGGYMGSFSVLLLIALVLIVFGWRSSTPTLVYMADPALRSVGIGLMVLALILFVASKPPTSIKRFLRHPQLSSVVVWSIAHLLMNGDSRSVVLFGGLLLWAILQMLFINRREGAWQKPEAPGLISDIKVLVIGAVVFGVVAWLHPYLAGVPVF